VSGQYDQLIKNGVIEYLPEGFDWRIIKAQFFQESRFQPNAVSPVGARGIAQIMPNTWDRWALPTYKDPFNAEQSIMTGCRYMAYLYGQWKSPRPEIDRICLALASYNAGLGHILKAQKLADNASLYAPIIAKLPEVTGKHSAETIDYVRKILGYWCKEIVE
jgi:membrane-bound lytic murein transglycosylase F